MQTRLANPEALGGVELLDEAGRGSSAVVYRARSEASRATFALKVGHGEEALVHLHREGVALASVESPHLPTLIDAGWVLVAKGRAEVCERSSPRARPYLAMEWLEGADARHAELSADELLQLAEDLGAALEALHSAGRAHGDLKPSNVILGSARAMLVDLGLTGPLHARALEGATPRYLARGDADLGDAGARDRLALGVVLAELGSASVRAAQDAVAAAREQRLEGALGEIVKALVAARPEARPHAGWVSSRARAARGGGSELTPSRGHRGLGRARVRAVYARLRERVLSSPPAYLPEGHAAYLEELCAWGRVLTSLGATGASESPALGFDGNFLSRWLVSLVGPVAAGWPLGRLLGHGEAKIAAALEALATHAEPATWTLRDVELAVEEAWDDAPAPISSAPSRRPARASSPPDLGDATVASTIALALSRVPAERSAVRAVEDALDPPLPLVVAAADALRLAGESGRALALCARALSSDDTTGDVLALAAEVARRAGDLRDATRLAERALDAARTGRTDRAGSARARAVLGRIALDDGRIDEALSIVRDDDSAAPSEVHALALAAKGEPERALEIVERALHGAVGPEQAARLEGVRGYVLSGREPEGARAAFASAADHAVRAGAVQEEATYLVGLAAAGVDGGYLTEADGAARRAALLWEVLGRPERAARAWLSRAAAHAAAGRRDDALGFAELAIEHARAGEDPRAEGYAVCVLADIEPGGAHSGREAAIRALGLLGTTGEDGLRAAARAWQHGADGGLDRAALDALASTARCTPSARFEWWFARARRSLLESATADGAPVVTALSSLRGASAPVSTKGRALAEGAALARELGMGEAAVGLELGAAELAKQLCSRAGPELEEGVRRAAWVARVVRVGEAHPEDARSARELEALVQRLAGTERLGELLRAALDVLVAWTGVERGLLLLPGPDGRLVPRVGRHLARRDLSEEQLTLSQSIARRAALARAPVVAVDAATELPDLHASVHALKLRSVVAVPLIAHAEVLGVAYLDDRVRVGAFGARELAWIRTVASLVATMIAAERARSMLRREAGRSRRQTRSLGEQLAQREAELAQVRSTRGLASAFDAIVGDSRALGAALRVLERVAPSDLPVLLLGESGSGKELFARALHAASPRANKAFVSENCGAVPETLLESTLFGHVRGAFTGAERARAGLFEAADGGTLFLDEIGEMTLAMQTKLLRVLEDGIVRPVGGEHAKKVDVRIVAATHRDLSSMVESGGFREDLYYRLSIVPVRVPALRERREDIPALVQHLLAKHAPGVHVRLSPEALTLLCGASWPGNVRQLENEIRRALVLGGDEIGVEHLTPGLGGPSASSAGRAPRVGRQTLREQVDALEASLVREALAETEGNQTKAAKQLGLSRYGLQKMMKRLGVEH